MPRKIRTIDPSLNLGLHELGKSGSFRFQLEFSEKQTEQILSNFGKLAAANPMHRPSRRWSHRSALATLR
jgi:hypothetical protein